jgi:hypothetical protein
MLIAREKRSTNIAEYILYMWQVEDTIRAFEFDIEKLDRILISQYDQDAEVRKEIREWYDNIASHMKVEKTGHSGHLRFLKNIVDDLYGLHLHLLQQPGEQSYSELFSTILPLIREMDAKQQRTAENEIETCLNAVYILMMMRLKKKPVSDGTLQAITLFIRFLGMLSARYKEREDNASEG